jgi:hypothetical protein
VLNENAVDFLRKAASSDASVAGFNFNVKQAETLRDTLQALLGGEPALPDAEALLVPADASQ